MLQLVWPFLTWFLWDQSPYFRLVLPGEPVAWAFMHWRSGGTSCKANFSPTGICRTSQWRKVTTLGSSVLTWCKGGEGRFSPFQWILRMVRNRKSSLLLAIKLEIFQIQLVCTDLLCMLNSLSWEPFLLAFEYFLLVRILGRLWGFSGIIVKQHLNMYTQKQHHKLVNIICVFQDKAVMA